MHHRTRLLTVTAVALGFALWLYGALRDGDFDRSDLRSLGAVVMILAGVALIARRRDAMVDIARQDGYDDGFDEGRGVRTPLKVVGSDGSNSSPLLGATKKFS